MISGIKCRLLDLGFVAALLLIAAVPLIFLRGHAFLDRAEFLIGLPVLLTGMVALWTILAPRLSPEVTSSEALAQKSRTGKGGLSWWQTVLIAVLLAAVVFVSFYRPLRFHFWGGADDYTNIIETPVFTLLGQWDLGINRPLTGLPTLLGQYLSPGRIDGFLWVATGLCWLNGLLLFGIVRLVFPRAGLLAVAAAVLLIIDRSDAGRFMVMWATNFYWTALVLLLLGLWLFLWSYRNGSRPLLVLSCLALAGSLLTNEAAYPLALVGPVLAWFLKEQRRRLPVWTFAWIGALALLASRLLIFLFNRGSDSYLAIQSGSAYRNPLGLWNTLWLHLGAGLGNFQVSGAIQQHWKQALIILTLVVVLGSVAVWRGAQGKRPRLRNYGSVLGVAILALLLGSVPFLHMHFIFRTQFFAAPGLAILIACVLCLAGSLLGRRVGAVVAVTVLGLLTANATAETITLQQHRRATEPVNFERMVHIFRQIHAVCPNPEPNTLMLLYLDEPHYAPFLCNYCCMRVSERVLGAVVMQANYADPVCHLPIFQEAGIEVAKGKFFGFTYFFPYDKVIVFRLCEDGTVTLQRQLPPSLRSQGRLAAHYRPLELLRPGPIGELDYLRFPNRNSRPSDLFDMSDGILLGHGWGPLKVHNGKLSRRVAAGAELVVNSLGQSQRRLCFRLEGREGVCLEAIDLEDKVIATGCRDDRGQVQLIVPTDPTQVSLVRLRLTGNTQGEDSFRVFCAGDKLADYQRPIGWLTDIVNGDLMLGANWHTLEAGVGKRSFRWVTNDAEIILDQPRTTSLVLLLEVEPGPSMKGQSCQLSVQDSSGKTLASAGIQSKEMVRLKLPADPNAGTTLRLHVEGVGRSLSYDPRILNFGVFHCSVKAE